MNNLCTDIAYRSLIKHGEQLCGDMVEAVGQGDNSDIIVLADGLGSGVKANILSTLTSKIISTMMSEGMDIENCVETVAATLPVCGVRGIAYSTFTIIKVTDNNLAEIIEYDNPHVFLLRDGKHTVFPHTITKIDSKTIYRSTISLKEGDVLIGTSDGAIHAGVGKSLNFGWLPEDIIKFIEKMYIPEYTANTYVTLLLDECNLLYGDKPGDDTTVVAVKIRNRQSVNLLFGPPANPMDKDKMMSLFFSKSGKHIVSGGTTSQIAAEYLGKTVVPNIDYMDSEIPPIAKIEGVDLTTEGVITINKVLSYVNNYLDNNECYYEWSFKKDGASQIAKMLLEDATDINICVGRAINPAHQNPNLPINFSIKMRLVEELSDALKKIGKKVVVSYF